MRIEQVRDDDLIHQYTIDESLVDSKKIKMYRCPNLEKGEEKDKLELTKIASQIVKTKRNDLDLLN